MSAPASTGRYCARTCARTWAGAVGAAFFRHDLDHGRVTRKGTTRIVAVTDTGRAVLREQLGLGNAALEASGSEPFCPSRPSRGES
ncbi:hypothetical protein ACH4SK_31290 [Streptomyces inhibens]|uniref:hypothetical protein n=1 Tax=Streptomyces inhibens TaxID=2293571 RepID=UPI00378A87EC